MATCRKGGAHERVGKLEHGLNDLSTSRLVAGRLVGMSSPSASPAMTMSTRIQSENGVSLTADHGDEERCRQRDEHEYGRNHDDRRQRLRPVLGANHIDETIHRRTTTHWGRAAS